MSFDLNLPLQKSTDFPTDLVSNQLDTPEWFEHPTAPNLALVAYI